MVEPNLPQLHPRYFVTQQASVEIGFACHMGRVGTTARLAWAARVGADSVDSTTFAKSGANGQPNRFARISAAERQSRLEVAIT